jgi:hypothetical protein
MSADLATIEPVPHHVQRDRARAYLASLEER